MRRTKGFSISEVIVYVAIASMTLLLILSTINMYVKNYIALSKYSNDFTTTCEALMYIEREINRGKSAYLCDGNLYINKTNKVQPEIVKLEGSTLYYEYKDDGIGYTKQPILYGVKEFILDENGNVIYIKINTMDGVIGEKAVEK